jgi:orotidine-5'-phosphate decarboxylase
MNRIELIELINKKQSFLCVGLDTDTNKLPDHLPKNAEGVLEFNKQIIDSTKEFAVSFKLNIAFYEALGIEGWKALEKTINYIPKDQALVIADAKRGDIGNTADQYAKAFFENLKADAITVNPYMGRDSVEPFLKYVNKWTIALGLTSNIGAIDIELMDLKNGRKVYEDAIDSIAKLGTIDNLMFVVGATKVEYFEKIRTIIPDHFLLIPGVGAQGGKLQDLQSAMNEDCGLLVNSSRQIIYASKGVDFAEQAAVQASVLQRQMAEMLK